MHMINIMIHVPNQLNYNIMQTSNFRTRLHLEFQIKKTKLLLCTNNYVTHKNLVNGANEIFQGSNKSPNSQEVGWVLFNYPYSNQFRWKNFQELWKTKLRNKLWAHLDIVISMYMPCIYAQPFSTIDSFPYHDAITIWIEDKLWRRMLTWLATHHVVTKAYHVFKADHVF